MRKRLTTKTASKKGEDRELAGAPEYDKTKVVHIFNILAQTSAALEATKLASSELLSVAGDALSPDGRLGGRGYVMAMKDMKAEFSDMSNKLSDIRDTLADELNNPGWGLSEEEKASINSVQEDTADKVENSVEKVTDDVANLFGEDEEESDDAEVKPAEDSARKDKADEGGTEDSDEFPAFLDDDEEKNEEKSEELDDEETPKFASSNNIFFKGLDKQSDRVTRKIASSVLTGLVKSSASGTKVGEN